MKLSVVMTIVDGGDILIRCLEALNRQIDPPEMEVLIPYDDSIGDLSDLIQRFPKMRFISMGPIETARDIKTAAGQHELYDRRRSRGLHEATGDLVGILEDRGAPREDWAQTVVRLHAELPYGVIGGAIEGEPGEPLNWAFYVCDFGRYGLPFESGPATWVSDVNVTYKRYVVEATRHLWKDRFREPIVHWALLEQGETLYLSADLVVIHDRPYASLSELLPERFHWGRLFGHIRGMEAGPIKRVAYAAAAPIIPGMLLLRHGRTQMKKRRFSDFVKVAPAVAVMLVAWTSGEAWGYLTGES